MSTDPGSASRPARRWWHSPYAWVTTTYFAEGYPYMVVNGLAEVLFTELGASLRVIGLSSLFHLPWNLKFLWGPFVDEYETKRRWLLATEVVLSVLLLLLSFVSTSLALLPAISACFLAIALLSATHDVAIDGYYLEGLDERGQAQFVGYRAAAWRGAAVVISGPLLVLAKHAGWVVAIVVTALGMAAITVLHWFTLPDPETRQRPIAALVRAMATRRVLAIAAAIAVTVAAVRAAFTEAWIEALRAAIAGVPLVGSLPLGGFIGLLLLAALLVVLGNLARIQRRLARRDSAYARAFVTFLDQPKIARALAFILLFRTGESFLMKMRYPFLKREVEMDLDTYGIVNGTIGLIATLTATIVGGHLIVRHGLRRWIWPFLLAQNVLNLSYAWLAWVPDPSATDSWIVAAVVTAEHFGAGLGNAVLMVFILRCCDPRHKAAHMAIVTSLMSLGFTLAGAISGDVADSMGFASYFVLTFVLTIPAMLLVPFVPHIDGREVRPA